MLLLFRVIIRIPVGYGYEQEYDNRTRWQYFISLYAPIRRNMKVVSGFMTSPFISSNG
jgi:hypothetical protein